VHGAWLPLLIGVTTFTVLTTWQRGRQLVTQRREHDEGSLREFIDELRDRTPPVQRVPGTAVFLNRTTVTTPLAMRASVEHLHALNEHVVILSIDTLAVPRVPPADRLVIDDLGYTDDGITHAGALRLHGRPRRPAVLRLIERADIESTTSYFLSTIDLVRGDAPGMSRWRKSLSWPPRTSPPTPPSTSTSRATARSSSARASRSSAPDRRGRQARRTPRRGLSGRRPNRGHAARGKLFGLDGVSGVLGGLHRPSPTEAVTILRARAADFAYGTLTDDLCLLAARIN
jgi:hypothetical protein